jgi:hypothetical protein
VTDGYGDPIGSELTAFQVFRVLTYGAVFGVVLGFVLGWCA